MYLLKISITVRTGYQYNELSQKTITYVTYVQNQWVTFLLHWLDLLKYLPLFFLYFVSNPLTHGRKNATHTTAAGVQDREQ